MSQYQRAVIYVILAGACLSTLGIGTRLLESASGLQVVFYRSIGTGGSVLLFLAYLHGRALPSRFIAIGKIGLLATACLVGASIFIVLAVVNTSVANAMFIISLAPLVAGLMAWLLIGERVSKTTLIASAIALAGVVTIVQGALSTDGTLGIIYAFIMLLCYGLFSVCLRIGRDVDMLPCACLQAFLLVIGLGLVLDDLSIPMNDLLICLALGVFQLGLGTVLLIYGSKHVPAAQLTLLAMLEIVLNPIWVWLGVGEEPSQAALIGGAIILVAVSYQAVSETQELK